MVKYLSRAFPLVLRNDTISSSSISTGFDFDLVSKNTINNLGYDDVLGLLSHIVRLFISLSRKNMRHLQLPQLRDVPLFVRSF